MTKLTGAQLARLRLQAQSLVSSTPDGPVDAVRRMLAMQAQDFGAAQWAIGARVPNATIHTVQEALNQETIVRSWPMRGTLHFSRAEQGPLLGPMRNGQQTLVLLDEGVPRPRILERDEALGEFMLRYVAGHGPVTVKDFA